MEKEYTFSNIDLCRQCGGTGEVEHHPVHKSNGMFQFGCNYTDTCSLCGGSGLVRIEKQIKVTITPHNPRGGVK